jgi:ABC-2 type transport system ATP-binding protein
MADAKPKPKRAKPAKRPAARKAAPRRKQTPPAIQAFGLERVFRSRIGEVRAVDGIDLEVRTGEVYGFLGPNGAGKSTTVLMLTTLLPPSGGRAVVGGFDVATRGSDVRRTIGAALQEAALDPNLTGREHIRMQATLHGIARAESDRLATELLERVGLTEAANRRTNGYSGGMKRRLDLALALVHAPKILFLDEPTVGLDVQSRTALWDEVRRLAHDDGVTVFLTTQYLEEADALADRVGIIDRGHIVAEDTPARLKAQIGRPTVEVVPAKQTDLVKLERALTRFGEIVPGTRRDSVAVRISGADPLTRVVRALDRARLPIANVELHAPTLADVFLEKTGRQLEGASDEDDDA